MRICGRYITNQLNDWISVIEGNVKNRHELPPSSALPKRRYSQRGVIQRTSPSGLAL